MDKQDLIEQIAADTGFTEVKAGLAIDTILKVITEALKNGETVKLPKIGSFLLLAASLKWYIKKNKTTFRLKKM